MVADKDRIGRLIDSLADPARRDRTAALLVIAYCAVWTVYAVIAKSSQDIHFDMGEMVAWSREITWGTPKHPPLPVWLVGWWFTLFPLADWAYYLFAVVSATVAVWVCWVITGHFLDGDKRAVGWLLLTLVPFLNFQALKFNANAAMIPLWAVTTWAFLRSFQTRRLGWAAFAGLAAAAAMLAKYWSAVLLLGLALAALIDTRRGAYFRSAAPYVTIVIGAAAIAPHVAWLYANDFMPFAYAVDSHPASPLRGFASGIEYVAGALVFLTVPIVLVLMAARPSGAAIRDTLWPRDADRRLALLAFALPLLLPIAVATVSKVEVMSIWAMGGMTLVPVVLLGSPLMTLPRRAARRIVMVALAVPLIALALSPLIAVVIHRQGTPNYSAHYRAVALAVEKARHEASPGPLRLVGSYNNLLYGTVFYFRDRPSTFEIARPEVTPWTDEARIAREGIALFCPTVESVCMKALNERAERSRVAARVEVDISRAFAGASDAPVRYVIVIVPPRD